MQEFSLKNVKKSLQTILVVSFLLFSIVPAAFLTIFSFYKYLEAMDGELQQRLEGNVREISVIFGEFEKNLVGEANRISQDANLQYHLSANEAAPLEKMVRQWTQSQAATSVSVFSRDGRMLATAFHDQRGQITGAFGDQVSQIFLSDSYYGQIKDKLQLSVVEFGKDGDVSLVVCTKILGKVDKEVGYLEQVISVSDGFLLNLKKRLNLELMLLSPEGNVVVASNEDFRLYPEKFFAGYLSDTKSKVFELNIRKDPYGFIIQPLQWGGSKFYLGLGASRKSTKAVIHNVYFAFFAVFGVIVVLLIITSIITSRVIVKPIKELLSVIHQFRESDEFVRIPIRNETEIGLLIESFNDMLQRIVEAKTELKNKITELENAYSELKQTQAILVHSAKMASIGQLVAGIAHELNNPIGFIFSNMTYLRDYSQKLVDLVNTAEIDSQNLKAKMVEYEFDYIVEDLPRLIKSCEEGARRTRDIVVGLRNFSRLEEAKIKKINIVQNLDDTLNLLAGEFKARITVHKNYGELPEVECFPSQLNQVFMNILSNGAQSIEGEGDIWITTKIEDRGDDKEWISVAIQDNGRGMSPSVVEKIFDPFFTTKGVGKGTGLGLSISYGIVEQHGGEIRVTSKVGVGTEFIVFLPVHAAGKILNPAN